MNQDRYLLLASIRANSHEEVFVLGLWMPLLNLSIIGGYKRHITRIRLMKMVGDYYRTHHPDSTP